MLFTAGLVTRVKPGWVSTVTEGLRPIHGDSGSYRVTTSSLAVDVEAVTHAVQKLASKTDTKITHIIILAESINLMPKAASGRACAD